MSLHLVLREGLSNKPTFKLLRDRNDKGTAEQEEVREGEEHPKCRD